LNLSLVIAELEEQLRYATETDNDYANQLKLSIKILNKYHKEDIMNELTLSGLLRLGHSDYAKNCADYMVVLVAGPTPEPEIIINPSENFSEKLAYYEGAYNEDLTLKNNPSIKIVGYNFCTRQDLVDAYL
jgi:hypothetical protein